MSLNTVNGRAHCVKISVFKREVWLSYDSSNNSTWYNFTVDQVKDFITQNKQGKPTKSLEDLNKEFNDTDKALNQVLIEESSLQRFENQKTKRRRKRSAKPNEDSNTKNIQGSKADGTNNAKRKSNKKRYKKNKPNQKGD